MEAIRVITGSRLHFGLLRLPPRPDWPEDGTRYFGGAGLMLEHPATIVTVRKGAAWRASGPHASRALRAARRMAVAMPMTIAVESAPDAHVGLGCGTQLDLAVARGVGRLGGRNDAVKVLAQFQQRGLRSAVGIYGFAVGGFLVDAGKYRPGEISQLADRIEFPRDWPVVLLTPNVEPQWFGDQERSALATPDIPDDALLPSLLDLSVVPALKRGDFSTFAPAIGEFNARVGDLFRPLQGGRYCHAAVEEIVAWLHAEGILGAGQSSWGPTVFGFCNDRDRAAGLAARARDRWADRVQVVVTTARNRGATVETA